MTSKKGTIIEYLSGRIFWYKTMLFPLVKAGAAAAIAFTIGISPVNDCMESA